MSSGRWARWRFARATHAPTTGARVRGVLWNNGWNSSYFTNQPGKAVVEKPYLLFTDRHLSSADNLLPIMEQIHKEGGRGLVVIATDVTGDTLNLLVTNKQAGQPPTLAVAAPGLGSEKAEVLADLAALCGGKVFLNVSGESIAKATLADLGQADEVQAIRSSFSPLWAGGDGLQSSASGPTNCASASPTGPMAGIGSRLIERQSKLTGGVAVLEIGGASDVEQECVRSRVEEAVRVVRLALQEGSPRSGTAYLACIPAVENLALPPDEAPAIAILCEALTAPTRAIISNAGIDASPILARLRERGGLGLRCSAPGDCGDDYHAHRRSGTGSRDRPAYRRIRRQSWR